MTRLPTTAAQRQATARQMTPGSGGGRTPLVAPTPKSLPVPSVTQATIEAPTFGVIGDMAVSTSNPYRVLKGGLIKVVNFDSDGGATGDTEFDVLLNGSPASAGATGLVVAQADDDETLAVGDVRAVPGDILRIDITQAGMHAGAEFQVVMES